MNSSNYLRQSTILSIAAFILLAGASAVSFFSLHPSSQELFETISGASAYSKSLSLAAPGLRTVLFIDAIFALSYTAAICFAAIGFKQKSPPLAWFVSIGIICVMMLDYWENTIMIQSIELIALKGEISLDRIIHQSTVSSIKWYSAATVLFAVSFLLPSASLIEKLLVLGTRIGLAISVPLFLINGFGLREVGQFMILSFMASGFVLLAIVTWGRSGEKSTP